MLRINFTLQRGAIQSEETDARFECVVRSPHHAYSLTIASLMALITCSVRDYIKIASITYSIRARIEWKNDRDRVRHGGLLPSCRPLGRRPNNNNIIIIINDNHKYKTYYRHYWFVC